MLLFFISSKKPVFKGDANILPLLFPEGVVGF
jgi:hypothetical protein